MSSKNVSEKESGFGQSLLFFGISAFCILFIALNLYLILLYNPQTHARWYADAAIDLYSKSVEAKQNSDNPFVQKAIQDDAKNLFFTALSLDPYNPSLWVRFAKMEENIEGDCTSLCSQAWKIAVNLNPSLSNRHKPTEAQGGQE